MLGFKKNIGLIDRAARILVGASLIVITILGYANTGWSVFWVLLGAYLIVIGLLAYSPLYRLLGIYSDDRWE